MPPRRKSLALFLGSGGELRLDPVERLHQPQSAAGSRGTPKRHGADVGGLRAHGLGDELEQRQSLLGLRHGEHLIEPAQQEQQQG